MSEFEELSPLRKETATGGTQVRRKRTIEQIQRAKAEGYAELLERAKIIDRASADYVVSEVLIFMMRETKSHNNRNLNRVHGARREDVVAALPKVDNIARMVAEADLGPKVVTLKSWAGSTESRDALKSCDVIFGATDDHSGRMFLNRLARYYGIPLIDLGLRMKRHDDAHVDVFGRVTTCVQGHRCLMCYGVMDPKKAANEALERDDPDNFQKLKDEAYVLGGGDPSPAVVTFTTEIACLAVNELVAAVTSFQGPHGMTPNRVRRFHAQDDRFPSAPANVDCPICGGEDLLGRADIEPFLGTVS